MRSCHCASPRPYRSTATQICTKAPLTALLLLALAACQPDSARQEPRTVQAGEDARPGGTVVIASGRDIAGVNPLLAQTQFSREIHGLLFLRLFAEQADYAERPPTLAPKLAASREWSADNLILRLRLREDVSWSDGVPVTADDVVWSYRAAVDPDVAWTSSGSLEGIEEVRAIGPYSVEFRFAEIYASRLLDVNEIVVLPSHAWRSLPFSQWRQNGEWFLENLVVNGPFQLGLWRRGQDIALDANPNYYRAGYPLLEWI